MTAHQAEPRDQDMVPPGVSYGWQTTSLPPPLSSLKIRAEKRRQSVQFMKEKGGKALD